MTQMFIKGFRETAKFQPWTLFIVENGQEIGSYHFETEGLRDAHLKREYPEATELSCALSQIYLALGVKDFQEAIQAIDGLKEDSEWARSYR